MGNGPTETRRCAPKRESASSAPVGVRIQRDCRARSCTTSGTCATNPPIYIYGENTYICVISSFPCKGFKLVPLVALVVQRKLRMASFLNIADAPDRAGTSVDACEGTTAADATLHVVQFHADRFRGR